MPAFEFTRVATVSQFKQVVAKDEDEAWDLMDTRPWLTNKVIDSDGIDCEEVHENHAAD